MMKIDRWRLTDGEAVERTLRRIAGDVDNAVSAGRSLEATGVGNPVRAVLDGAWAIGGVESVIDDATSGVGCLRGVPRVIEDIRRGLADAAGCSLVELNAAVIGGVDLISPTFLACRVGHAGAVADVLAGGE